MMRFKIFLESEDFRDVETALKRVAQAYAKGGDKSLHRAMERHFTPEIEKRFAAWWGRGYYRDYDDHGITFQGTKFYTDNPNPNYRYLFAKIARSESHVKGQYKDVKHYLRQGWIMYAQRGSEGLGEWLGSLPSGFLSKFRRWMVDYNKGKIWRDTGIHYQLAQLVKNYSHSPQTDPAPLKVGDFLHKQRLESLLDSPYSTRDTFAGYPDLQDAWDQHDRERQERRAKHREFMKSIEDQ